MTANDIQAEVKASLPHGLEKKDYNQRVWALAQKLSVDVKKAVKEAKASVKKGASAPSSEELAKWLENPMTDEERSKYVRAAMDMELANGASIQDLERVAKTFGLGKGEDMQITTCDFGTAFPDLATAVALCHNKEA